MVVIGQVAGILHGSQELTGDVDLLWDGDPRHSVALAAAFSGRGAQLTGDDGGPLRCDAQAFMLPKVVFQTPGASGDLCSPALPWGEVDVLRCLARSRVATAAGGVHIRYVDVTDLITMRRSAGRPKDRRRADEPARVFRSVREPLPAEP